MAINVIIGTNSTWTTTSNWSTGAAPANGQDLYLTMQSGSYTLGLTTPTVALNTFNVDMSFTGSVGNPPYTFSTNTGSYLQMCSPIANIGLPSPNGSGAGSPRLNWDAGTTSTIVNVFNTASSSTDTGQTPLRLLGGALTINHMNGILSVGALQTENSTISSYTMTNGGGDIAPQAFIGPGVNLGTLTMTSGIFVTQSSQVIALATVARNASSINHIGSGGFTILTIQDGATLSYDGSGNIGTLTLGANAKADFSGGGSTLTITRVFMEKGATLLDPGGRITFTNKPVPQNCSLQDLTIDTGQGRTF